MGIIQKSREERVIFPNKVHKWTNYHKTSSLKKLREFSKTPSAAPDCLDACRGTYKGTLTELDILSKADIYKGRKCINMPQKIPFDELDLRKQRRIIKSLSRFEIIKAGQSPKRVRNQSLKQLRDGSYLQIKMASGENSLHNTLRSKNTNTHRDSMGISNQISAAKFSPVLNKGSLESSYSVAGSLKKSKNKDLSNEYQGSRKSNEQHTLVKEDNYKGIFKKALKVHADALAQESTQAFLRKRYYKNMVSNKTNTKKSLNSVYTKACIKCKKDTNYV
ncbi:unnamed protein product [Moneuplotes crassus]|uniref:Uncharacterized protein n=1 Tax=Euplotes crassus TaxID=5936 RepID=A0AAD1UM88_EUPCR|nr:unnamed protein product [Moneuplotes crassus]